MSEDARIILETISDGMPRVVVQWVVFILRPFRPQVPGWRLNPLVVVLSVGWRGECIIVMALSAYLLLRPVYNMIFYLEYWPNN